MSNKLEFTRYLTKKGRKQEYIAKCGDLLDDFLQSIKDELLTIEKISTFAGSRAYVDIAVIKYKFLNDYADFSKEKSPLITESIRDHCRQTFEAQARNAVVAYKNAIVPIPKDTKIDPQYLGNMTNEEFVQTFRYFQELIISTYEEIERDPLGWGYPDWKTGISVDGGNNNRVMETLLALVNAGSINNDLLVVDKKTFNANSKHVKGVKILEGLQNMGFFIEGLDDKKSDAFVVSFPDTPNMVPIIYSYFSNGDNGRVKCRIFSYRFVEAAGQPYEPTFLALTDGASKAYREIQYWLHDEAAKYGFRLGSSKPNELLPMYRGCINYTKGSKNWMLVGTPTPHFEMYHLGNGDYKAAVKIEFKNAYKKYPDKMNEFAKLFPAAIGSKYQHCGACNPDCDYRFNYKQNDQERHCCGYAYFWICDPSLDDVKTLLEYYKLENNIKSLCS